MLVSSVSYCLHKFLKLYGSQTKKLSQFLLLTVDISSWGLVCTLNSSSSRSSSKFKEFTLGCLVVISSLIRQKRKLIKMTTRSHSLLFAVLTDFHSLYHSLSFIVTRCHSLSLVVPLFAAHCHSLSLDVLPVCLFVNDLCLFSWERNKKTRNAMRCNNRDDLLQLSFTLKISIFSGAYI